MRTFCARTLAVVVMAIAAPCAGAGPLLIAMSDEVRGMCQQAEQLINARRFNEAISLLQRAAAMDPACAEVHGYLGMAYQNSLRTNEAIPEYQQALTLNPQMTFINVNLGTCYMNLNQLDQALPYFQRYLETNPNAPDAPQVRQYIQQAGARKGQQNLRALVEQGQAQLNQRRYNEARQSFEAAVAASPNFAPAHFYLGYTLAQMGDHQRAISEFQAALQLDPGMKEATLNIGSNYQSLGDSNSAIAWYERYLQENPGSPKAGDIRGRINGLRQQASQNRQAPRQQTQPLQPAMSAAAGGASPGSAQPFQWQGGGDPYAGLDLPQQPAALNSAPGQGYTAGMPQAQTAYAPPPAAQQAADYLDAAAAGGKYFRWPAERIPVRVHIASGSSVPGYRQTFLQDFFDALNLWTRASGNRLTFLIVPDPSQADIYCDWTDNPARVQEGGRAVEGGLTKLSGQPLPNGVDVNIVKARMTILTADRGGTHLSDDDMRKVCLHEVGHALGINGHSNDNRDIMFFSESPSIMPAPSARDAATIQRLYANYPPR